MLLLLTFFVILTYQAYLLKLKETEINTKNREIEKLIKVLHANK